MPTTGKRAQYDVKPPPRPLSLEGIAHWMEQELAAIAQVAGESRELELRPSFNAPPKPREGMIVYADGTSWNPGAGEGVYVYKNGAWQKLEAAPAGTLVNKGTATLDFGAFPGSFEASVAVTGQTGIISGSIVDARLRPVATADHSIDEHLIVSPEMQIITGAIVPGTGFTIYGFSRWQVGENSLGLEENQARFDLGKYPRLWGQWTIGWQWS